MQFYLDRVSQTFTVTQRVRLRGRQGHPPPRPHPHSPPRIRGPQSHLVGTPFSVCLSQHKARPQGSVEIQKPTARLLCGSLSETALSSPSQGTRRGGRLLKPVGAPGLPPPADTRDGLLTTGKRPGSQARGAEVGVPGTAS